MLFLQRISLYFHFVLILIFCEMDMRRYIERKGEFEEVDELPSIKSKTGAQKVAASHHGSDAGANESTGVQDAAASEYYSVSVGQVHSSVSEIGSSKTHKFHTFNSNCI